MALLFAKVGVTQGRLSDSGIISSEFVAQFEGLVLIVFGKFGGI